MKKRSVEFEWAAAKSEVFYEVLNLHANTVPNFFNTLTAALLMNGCDRSSSPCLDGDKVPLVNIHRPELDVIYS